MIPFASQRGGGQDLATHLLNEYDNDYVEVVDLRGSIAQDLHGAFAEWEVQANTLTKCKNYLYSLSINPDPRQGELTREQYLEYLSRVESKLGLEPQGRALVFHIKNGREHFHAVYSRIDAINEKAIHLAFDKDKLMMVTRLFAREQNLELPKGYFKDRNTPSREQLSLYEKHQQDTTGITKEERKAIVTACWKHSDNAKSFIAALEEKGYVLATGNRPYLLVDLYGNVNSLPKLIDGREINTKVIRKLLDKDFPVEDLPNVEDVKVSVKQHLEQFNENEIKNSHFEKLDALRASQKHRRRQLEEVFQTLKAKQNQEKEILNARLHDSRLALISQHLNKKRSIRASRKQLQPTGLAHFLGKVTGTNLVLRKIQKLQDAKRHKRYLEQRDLLLQRKMEQALIHQRRHEMQLLDVRRRMKTLDQVEQRELKALNTGILKHQRIKSRTALEHMPALQLHLSPPGRKAYPYKAKNRYMQRETKMENNPVYRKSQPSDDSLKRTFTKSAELKTKKNPIYKKLPATNRGKHK